jgi:hypothetical protein
MNRTIATATILMLTLAGCASKPDGQTVEAPKVDLTTKHIHAVCPLEISGVKGIHATIKECAITLAPGAQALDKVTCTGLTGNLGTIAKNRASTLTWSYYTPGGHQFAQVFRYEVEDDKAAKATCTLDAKTDKFGTYTIRLGATCYKDGNNWLPGVQLAPDGCSDQDDTISVRSDGRWF